MSAAGVSGLHMKTITYIQHTIQQPSTENKPRKKRYTIFGSTLRIGYREQNLSYGFGAEKEN